KTCWKGGNVYWELVWLCLAALAAGAVNSIAGGGTLLTFPALLAALSPLRTADAAVVANATSTVALVPGSLAGAWGFRRELKQAHHWLYLLVGPSLTESHVGTRFTSIPLSMGRAACTSHRGHDEYPSAAADRAWKAAF